MLSGADNVEPIVIFSSGYTDKPSEEELNLVLQFLPDIYRDMLACLNDNKEQ